MPSSSIVLSSQVCLIIVVAVAELHTIDALPNKLKSLEKQSWPPMKTVDIWAEASSDSSKLSASYMEHNLNEPALLNDITVFSHIEENKTALNRQISTTTTTMRTIFTLTPQPWENRLNGTKKVPKRKKFNELKGIKAPSMNKQEQRNGKVLNFFPVPSEHECLSDDGRRYGTCLNPYECHNNKGDANGECALGFGVCCVFVASCGSEISANNTYLVSPNFPSFMSTNITECKLKIKMMAPDISQLRIDFHHFLLGQPDRKTGECVGDSFIVTGGPSGNFTICGYNSGQHAYYDVGGRAAARQAIMEQATSTTTEKMYGQLSMNDNEIANHTTPNDYLDMDGEAGSDEPIVEDAEIIFQFKGHVIQKRFWEVQITQIPFSQRAPAGCLQYFTGDEGVFQTFNFADNGRHLANQNYRACFRQEMGMCSILYEPCDQQSFRIGATHKQSDVLADEAITEMIQDETTTPMASTTTTTTTTSTTTTTTTTPATTTISGNSVQADDSATDSTNSSSTVEDEAVEGSGSAANDEPIQGESSSSSPTVTGGFDFFGFLREAFDFGRRRSVRQMPFPDDTSGRQLYTTCTDRITLPCIIEDFISDGNFGCEPVHCGNQFCSKGEMGALGVSPMVAAASNSMTGSNMNVVADSSTSSKQNSNAATICRIESTVTPFFLGVHFGDGVGKGSPEDNIGACLKFSQVPCM